MALFPTEGDRDFSLNDGSFRFWIPGMKPEAGGKFFTSSST